MDFDFEKHNELKKECINEIATDTFSKLSKKDKKLLLENPEPLTHHFGYGMYIRNHFIRGKELPPIAVSTDRLSTEIVEEIIRRVQEEASEAG